LKLDLSVLNTGHPHPVRAFQVQDRVSAAIAEDLGVVARNRLMVEHDVVFRRASDHLRRPLENEFSSGQETAGDNEPRWRRGEDGLHAQRADWDSRLPLQGFLDRRWCGAWRGRFRLGAGDLALFVFLDAQAVVADQDDVAVLQSGHAGKRATVEAGAVVAAQVLDAKHATAQGQPRVLARDVLFSQTDGVAVRAADGDLLANEGYGDRLPFIVLDEQLVHGGRTFAPLEPWKALSVYAEHRRAGPAKACAS
jgi:hypothetical protein